MVVQEFDVGITVVGFPNLAVDAVEVDDVLDVGRCVNIEDAYVIVVQIAQDAILVNERRAASKEQC